MGERREEDSRATKAVCLLPHETEVRLMFLRAGTKVGERALVENLRPSCPYSPDPHTTHELSWLHSSGMYEGSPMLILFFFFSFSFSFGSEGVMPRRLWIAVEKISKSKSKSKSKRKRKQEDGTNRR